jgi:hypothetical protein
VAQVIHDRPSYAYLIVLRKSSDEFGYGIGMEDIVIIDEEDKFAFGSLATDISGRGYSPRLF